MRNDDCALWRLLSVLVSLADSESSFLENVFATGSFGTISTGFWVQIIKFWVCLTSWTSEAFSFLAYNDSILQLDVMHSDGILWARINYEELFRKKSSFLNCSEEKPSAHCSASALRLVCCAFANSLVDERVKERECYASSTLLSVFLEERKQTLLETFLVCV